MTGRSEQRGEGVDDLFDGATSAPDEHIGAVTDDSGRHASLAEEHAWVDAEVWIGFQQRRVVDQGQGYVAVFQSIERHTDAFSGEWYGAFDPSPGRDEQVQVPMLVDPVERVDVAQDRQERWPLVGLYRIEDLSTVRAQACVYLDAIALNEELGLSLRTASPRGQPRDLKREMVQSASEIMDAVADDEARASIDLVARFDPVAVARSFAVYVGSEGIRVEKAALPFDVRIGMERGSAYLRSWVIKTGALVPVHIGEA